MGRDALVHSFPAVVQMDRLTLLFQWGHWAVWELVWLCWSLSPIHHPRDPVPSLTPPFLLCCSFQIIDSENEALLAALTETLDDIQGDDMGLAAFRTMEEGDTLSPATTSPAPSPKPTAPVTGGPPAPEGDELSLVRTHFLLFKVDLDEPQISRLHGYDRKPRSEFFHSRLKTLFNRQYQSIYLYCIRIHVLHHCCHLHHHPHGNQLCVYKPISGWGGVGARGLGAALAHPHLLLTPLQVWGCPGLSLAHPSPVPMGSGGFPPWLCPGLSSLLSQAEGQPLPSAVSGRV